MIKKVNNKLEKKFIYVFIFIFVLLALILCCLVNDRDNAYKKNENSENIIYKNVIIRKNDDEYITFLSDNSEIKYKVKGLNDNLENVLADIEVVNGKVKTITVKRESISGKVQSVSEDSIEIEGFGKVYLEEDYKCYFKNKNYISGNINDVKVGAENIYFMVEDKYICGIIIEGEFSVEKVRVLLKTTGFKDNLHDKVAFNCPSDYEISYNEIDENGNIKTITDRHSKDEIFEFVPQDTKFDYGRIKITPIDKNNKIVFNSFTRNGKNPAYRGTIEVAKYDNKLAIINEVSIEEYLYSVVPSEMPSSYGVEALKVQAVCARSYAICHLGETALSRYGAQIDDSTNYQVYNNTSETENSIAAVDATRGEILRYDNSVVNAYFFATSCGSTTDSTIWGGTALPYIKGKLLISQKKDGADSNRYDLMNNDVFTEFIKSKPETFDDESAWYRWNTVFSEKEITDIINNNIGVICEKFPKYVLIKQGDGSFVSGKISNVGNILNIYVELRGIGGVIEELVIVGDKATVKILKQSAIRNLINPSGIDITKADGNKVNHFTSLPSAYFSIEKADDKYVLYGGGYGHGAGMSQTAVKKMIKEKMGYKEILEFFYTGVNIEENYAK